MGIFSWLFLSQDNPKNSYHFSDWPFVFGRSATSCLRISRELEERVPVHQGISKP